MKGSRPESDCTFWARARSVLWAGGGVVMDGDVGELMPRV